MEQRLIDANAINVEDTIGGQNDFADCIRDSVQMVLDNAKTFLIIPENATNGDMIKALFPNAEIFKREEYGYHYVFVTIKDMGNCWKIRGEWWNAPYK